MWQLVLLLKLLLSRNSQREVHLCELIASVHFSDLPRIHLDKALQQIKGSVTYQITDVHIHPNLRSEGSGSASEMSALSSLVAAKCPARILEFGTYDGISTWHLWANSSSNTKIVTIDLPSDTKVTSSSDFGLQGISNRPFIPQDTRINLVETDSRNWIPDLSEKVDFCFIDAGHTYECVRNDTEKALPLMNKHGVLVWHDATWTRDGYGVNQYLEHLRNSGWDIKLLEISPYDYCSLAILILDEDIFN
jgi:predicted O-methyltransferase YrrM